MFSLTLNLHGCFLNPLVHLISDIAKQGVKAVGSKATSAAARSVDKGVTKTEQTAGIKRKQLHHPANLNVGVKKK